MATIKKNKIKAGWMPQTPEHTRAEMTPERTADIKYLQSTYWRSVRQQVLNRDLALCQECLRHGITKEGNQVDHILARKDNPDFEKYREDIDNLQTLCTACHARKTIKERNARK